MGLSKEKQEEVVREIASRIIEGCRKGVNTCTNCGQVSIPLWCMAEEFKPRVKDLVVKELGHEVKVGLCVDGYCEDCRWDKFGAGLDVGVVVRMAKDGEESPGEIVGRLTLQLKSLGVTFRVKGFARRYLREDRGWQ